MIRRLEVRFLLLLLLYRPSFPWGGRSVRNRVVLGGRRANLCDGADFDPEDYEHGVGRSDSELDSDAGAGAGLVEEAGTDGGREHYLEVGYVVSRLLFSERV